MHSWEVYAFLWNILSWLQWETGYRLRWIFKVFCKSNSYGLMNKTDYASNESLFLAVPPQDCISRPRYVFLFSISSNSLKTFILFLKMFSFHQDALVQYCINGFSSWVMVLIGYHRAECQLGLSTTAFTFLEGKKRHGKDVR